MYAKENNISVVNLEVRPSNTSAISLYTKYDFKEIGRRRNFYTKPTEDALLMQREIIEQ